MPRVESLTRSAEVLDINFHFGEAVPKTLTNTPQEVRNVDEQPPRADVDTQRVQSTPPADDPFQLERLKKVLAEGEEAFREWAMRCQQLAIDEWGNGWEKVLRTKAAAEMVKGAWLNGLEIPDEPPGVWREDRFGNRIKREDYGNATSQFGWVMVHIKPISEGGTHAPSNLCPLKWDAAPSSGRSPDRQVA